MRQSLGLFLIVLFLTSACATTTQRNVAGLTACSASLGTDIAAMFDPTGLLAAIGLLSAAGCAAADLPAPVEPPTAPEATQAPVE